MREWAEQNRQGVSHGIGAWLVKFPDFGAGVTIN
jgi:hypothetical protein